jgi:SHS2 domain-containing protein
MKKYENLEHIADLKIRAWGENAERLFANLAYGMMENIYENLSDISLKVERSVEIEAVDQKSLLVDFLSEILRISDEHNEVFREFEIKIEAGFKLKAKIKGERVQYFNEEIKAVTYHELKIAKESSQWVGEVVFDI